MFDIHRWFYCVSEQLRALNAEGCAGAIIFTDESRMSENPSFFVDLDRGETAGRLVIWSTGGFDLSVHRNGSDQPTLVAGLPDRASDENFQVIFERFVELVAS